MSDIDALIASLSALRLPAENQIAALCAHLKAVLLAEPNVCEVWPPVAVCGDVHGQFEDLLELFQIGGECPATSYLFLGDYVDRGRNSLETVLYLFALKLKFPGRVTLLRGNHESRPITETYGFYDECLRKLGSASAWRHCCDAFDCLALAAVVGGRALAVHGGISPNTATLDAVRAIDRRRDVPAVGPMCDLMWSDPEDVRGFVVSPRGAGYLFGGDALREFLHRNALQLLARAHQLVMEGFKLQFEEQLVTVWSAPNYCYRCGNLGAIMELDERGTKMFKTYEQAPSEANDNCVAETFSLLRYMS